MNHQALSSFIWSVADLLRGDYKQSEYGKVILPFTVLRRLDCVLEATKPDVLAEIEAKPKTRHLGSQVVAVKVIATTILVVLNRHAHLVTPLGNVTLECGQ